MPMLLPLSNKRELPSVPLVSNHLVRKFVLPNPVTAELDGPDEDGFIPPELRASLVDAAALLSMNAENGLPPSVSASPALSAYGTDTSKTRGCSASPWTRMPNQRAAPLANKSNGRPSALVDPSSNV